MKIYQDNIIGNCKLLAYKIKWTKEEGGGSSVASIYMTRNGTLMLAPSNWLAPAPLKKCLSMIKWIKELK